MNSLGVCSPVCRAAARWGVLTAALEGAALRCSFALAEDQQRPRRRAALRKSASIKASVARLRRAWAWGSASRAFAPAAAALRRAQWRAPRRGAALRLVKINSGRAGARPSSKPRRSSETANDPRATPGPPKRHSMNVLTEQRDDPDALLRVLSAFPSRPSRPALLYDLPQGLIVASPVAPRGRSYSGRFMAHGPFLAEAGSCP